MLKLELEGVTVWYGRWDGPRPGMRGFFRPTSGGLLLVKGEEDQPDNEWTSAYGYYVPARPSISDLKAAARASADVLGIKTAKTKSRGAAEYAIRRSFREAQSFSEIMTLIVVMLMILAKPVSGAMNLSGTEMVTGTFWSSDIMYVPTEPEQGQYKPSYSQYDGGVCESPEMGFDMTLVVWSPFDVLKNANDDVTVCECVTNCAECQRQSAGSACLADLWFVSKEYVSSQMALSGCEADVVELESERESNLAEVSFLNYSLDSCNFSLTMRDAWLQRCYNVVEVQHNELFNLRPVSMSSFYYDMLKYVTMAYFMGCLLFISFVLRNRKTIFDAIERIEESMGRLKIVTRGGSSYIQRPVFTKIGFFGTIDYELRELEITNEELKYYTPVQAATPVQETKSVERKVEESTSAFRILESAMQGSIPTSGVMMDCVLQVIVKVKGEDPVVNVGSCVSVAQGIVVTASHVITPLLAMADQIEEVYVSRWVIKGKSGHLEKMSPLLYLKARQYYDRDLAIVPVMEGLKTARLMPASSGVNVVMFGATKRSYRVDEMNSLNCMVPGTIVSLQQNGTMLHSVSTLKGDSGNALFYGNCVVGIHTGAAGAGSCNDAVYINQAIIDWIREQALSMRAYSSLKESWDLEMLCKEWGISINELRRSASDPHEYSIEINGQTILIDATAHNRVFTSIIDDDGEEIAMHPLDISDSLNVGKGQDRARKRKSNNPRKVDKQKKIKKINIAHGGKASKYGRSGKRAGRLMNKLNRQARREGFRLEPLSGREGFDFIDEYPASDCESEEEWIEYTTPEGQVYYRNIITDEKRDTLPEFDQKDVEPEVVSCLNGCEVVTEVERRVYKVESYERKLMAEDFGLEEEKIEKFSVPRLNAHEEQMSVQRILGAKDMAPLQSGELKSFKEFLDMLFKRKPDFYKGEITLDEAWAELLKDNSSKTPGIRFMSPKLAPCGKVHNLKQEVFECSVCKNYISDTISKIQSGSINYDPIFNCFLKREITKKSKIDNHSQRVIFGGDLIFELIQRMVGSSSYKAMESYGVHNPIIMGMSMLWGGHKSVQTRLQGFSCTAGDTKTMDLSLNKTMIGVAIDSWYHLTKTPDSVLSRLQKEILVHNKVLRVCNQVVRVTDEARDAGGVNPSGHLLTTIINSFGTLFPIWRSQWMSKEPPSLKENRIICANMGVIVSGDDFVLGSDDGKIAEKLEKEFSRCGLEVRDLTTTDDKHYTFLGFEHYFDNGLKIRMAFPERSYLRLKFPLDKKTVEEYHSQLKNYSIQFVNNPAFYSGLVKLAGEAQVSLFDAGFARAIMNGDESQGDHPAILIDYNEAKQEIRSRSPVDQSIPRILGKGTNKTSTGDVSSLGGLELASPRTDGASCPPPLIGGDSRTQPERKASTAQPAPIHGPSPPKAFSGAPRKGETKKSKYQKRRERRKERRESRKQANQKQPDQVANRFVNAEIKATKEEKKQKEQTERPTKPPLRKSAGEVRPEARNVEPSRLNGHGYGDRTGGIVSTGQ